jgi:hypothetical protein
VNPEELLLRDIHLPEPVSWWPPAIGWWMLAILIVISIGAITWWQRRRQAQRNAPASIARLELARLRAAWIEHRDANRLVTQLSTWLRRAGMSMSSRRKAASLTGTEWLAFLDEMAGESVFGTTATQMIVEAPYRKVAQPDGETMLTLCERWLSSASQANRRRGP